MEPRPINMRGSERKPETQDRLRVTRSRTAAAAAASVRNSGATATSSVPLSNITASTTSSRSTNTNIGNESARPRKRVKLNNPSFSKNVFLGVRSSQLGKRPVRSATEVRGFPLIFIISYS